MAAKTRLYRVESNGKVHLVDAYSQSQAVNHVITQHHKVICEIASPKMVMTLIAGGISMEEAAPIEQPAAAAEPVAA